jgi:hypothetical protein
MNSTLRSLWTLMASASLFLTVVPNTSVSDFKWELYAGAGVCALLAIAWRPDK